MASRKRTRASTKKADAAPPFSLKASVPSPGPEVEEAADGGDTVYCKCGRRYEGGVCKNRNCPRYGTGPDA